MSPTYGVDLTLLGEAEGLLAGASPRGRAGGGELVDVRVRIHRRVHRRVRHNGFGVCVVVDRQDDGADDGQVALVKLLLVKLHNRHIK